MIKFIIAAATIAGAVVLPAHAESYAPMAPFAGLDGKAYRAEWFNEGKKKTVDIATYELILDGRAVQSTHRIEGSTYGGRTIIFYDEGAKKYVFHYFTTGGFHTTGTAEVKDGVMTSEEKVEGHATIASVRSSASFAPGSIRVEVTYVGKDGSQSPQPARIYAPIAHPGELFPK